MTGRTLRRLPPRLGRALAIVALVAFAMLSVIGPSMVLCVGADGHLMFEPVSAVCCDDAASGAPGAPASVAAAPGGGATADCDGCIDVSFRGDVSAQATAHPAADLPAPALLESAAVAAFAQRAARAAPRLADPGAGGRAAVRDALRTVVLRV